MSLNDSEESEFDFYRISDEELKLELEARGYVVTYWGESIPREDLLTLYYDLCYNPSLNVVKKFLEDKIEKRL